MLNCYPNPDPTACLNTHLLLWLHLKLCSVQCAIKCTVQCATLTCEPSPTFRTVKVSAGRCGPSNIPCCLYVISLVFGQCSSLYLYLYFHLYFDFWVFSRIPHRWSRPRGGPSTIACYSPPAGSKISMNKSSKSDSRGQHQQHHPIQP